MRISHYFLIVFSFSFWSCCKEPEQCDFSKEPYYSVSPLISSMVFKPGSYWIYKNMQNNTIDSVYVFTLDSGYTTDPPRVKCSFSNHEYYYLAKLKSQNIGEFNLVYIRNKVMSNVQVEYSKFIGTNEYYNSDSSKANSLNIEYIQQYQSISIQNSNYYLVDKIKVMSSQIGGSNAFLYWASSIGIIKFEKENGEVWELTDGRYYGIY